MNYSNIEVGIHRHIGPTDIVGHMIDEWTRRTMGRTGPWILRDGPSTHAFLVVDGFRLDAAAPHTGWHLDARLGSAAEARWRIGNLSQELILSIVERARMEDGKLYDLGEGLQQTMVPILSLFNKNLAQSIGQDMGLKLGHICTTTVTTCLSCIPDLKNKFDVMHNHAPETLGKIMQELSKPGANITRSY